jgi:hypothetical protein
MLTFDSGTTGNQAATDFAEWASDFSEGIFVHLTVYVDESGTHDPTGGEVGAQYATFGGVAGLGEEWPAFCAQWATALKKHNAPYFHYREWKAADVVARLGRAPKSDFDKNPYRDWDADHLSAFIVELATITGSGNQFPVGDYVFTKQFHEAKLKGEVALTSDPYERMANNFFESTTFVISRLRPTWKRVPVHFVFDAPPKGDTKWISAISGAYLTHKEMHPRSRLSWLNKTQPEGLPLQAADLVAYRSRIATADWVNKNWDGVWPEVDFPLFKPMFDWMTAHPEVMLPYFFSGEAFNYDKYKE